MTYSGSYSFPSAFNFVFSLILACHSSLFFATISFSDSEPFLRRFAKISDFVYGPFIDSFNTGSVISHRPNHVLLAIPFFILSKIQFDLTLILQLSGTIVSSRLLNPNWKCFPFRFSI